jgi:hypothetical protein
MIRTLWIALGIFLGWTSALRAQTPDTLFAPRTTAEIRVDGLLDEPDWGRARGASAFFQQFPIDTCLAVGQTSVRILFDQDYIYIGALMYNLPDERNYVTPSLRRDFRGEANDAVVIVFDPFQDNTNAFQFGVNPFGVQREGLVVNGGNESFDLDLSWDNRWYATGKQYEGYWIGEFAIPLKSLRYKEGSKTWNIKIYRIDSEYGERSVWPQTPRQFPIMNLAFANKLIWEQPLPKPGGNVVAIPFATASYSENRLEGGQAKRGSSFGGDAKIGLGPALNLDLTVNPDFSQVEVDQQVTNLDRFEIFFPERRQFFLENADLFSNFGIERLRPFFSRRIGVARDEATGQNVQNPIYLGARVSGKLDDNWRLGLLSMQAARDLSIGQPSVNYSVAALQRKVFSRSNIGLIAVSKQPILDQDINAGLDDERYDFNRVLGLDYNLASKDSKWTGKAFYHHSFQPDQAQKSFASGAQMSYSTQLWEVFLTVQSVGENYNPETGFARRVGYQRIAHTTFRSIFPKKGPVNSHSFGIDFDALGNQRYGVTDWDANLIYRIMFKNTAMFNIRTRREYVYLFSPFDPTNTGGVKLPEGTDYNQNLIIASFTSDFRKKVNFRLETRSGDYFNGSRLNLSGALNFRFQPYAVVSLDFSANRIRLPAPYSDADLLLIGPRFDFTFSKSVFWTTFVQYNNQIDNININSRFQWRFAPVSDLFVVYTDNYFPDGFVNKTRALVLKLTYWLNL